MAIVQDDYMRYDYDLHRYVLTLKYATDVLGINIEERVSSNRAVNATAVINNFLTEASDAVYEFLNDCNDTQTIAYIIAVSPTARKVIQKAMGKQFTYYASAGMLDYTANRELQDLSLNKKAKAELLSVTIPETGAVLGYCGQYRFMRLPSYTEGAY